ncbi:MAG: GNAT family N-acetyltransferase [Firmicutes bacterium]|nr:GNAT family N-acetyltransferase [Bacillota bacterium]
MESLRDPKRLSALMTAALKNRALTNGRLSPASYGRALSEGRLSLAEAGVSFLLFEDRGAFGLLRFWVCPEDEEEAVSFLKNFESEKPLVLETAMKEGGPRMADLLRSLENAGFHEAVSRRSMSAPAEDVLSKAGPPAFAPEDLRPEDLEEASALLAASFDPLTGCLPLASELAEDIKDRKLTCIREEGAMTGLLHFERSGKSLEISHIAVSNKRRGGGRAKALIASALAAEGAGTLKLWVNEDNEAGLKLYKSLGLKAGGSVSKVLVRPLQGPGLEL